MQAAQSARPAAAVSPVSAADQAVFTRYCLTCHTDALRRRGTVPAAFETLDVTRVARDAKAWESIVRKMRSGLMPPAGMPRPDGATHDVFVRRIEDALDAAAAARPNPGRTEPLHRLNRTEYRNAVRDLLDLDVNVAVAAAARRRQLRLRQHGRRAEDVADAAGALPGGGAEDQPSGDRHGAAGARRRTTTASPTTCGRTTHLEALPLGTRGGTTIRLHLSAGRRVRDQAAPGARPERERPAVSANRSTSR